MTRFLKPQFVSIVLLLLPTLLLSQALKQPEVHKFGSRKNPFSYIEFKAFYGQATRPLKISSMSAVNRDFYENFRKGNEFTLEASFHLQKALSISVFHSQFTTNTPSTSYRISVPGGYYSISNDHYIFNRSGGSFSVANNLSPKSYARIHFSLGLAVATVVNSLTMKGAGESFEMKLKSYPQVFPFFTAGISSSIGIPNFHVHFRFTKNFGEFQQLSNDNYTFRRDLSNGEALERQLNTLHQLSFQIGISIAINSSISN